jgi:hypothetical protein
MSIALFFALYCIEAGLFFLVVPWTHFWSANALLQDSAALAAFAANPFARGFVSGIGVIHILIGVKDILSIGHARRVAGE